MAVVEPLLALNAVVLDTETTGLDPTKVRILQIGALVLEHGSITPQTFNELLDPGVPIPVATTRIHGLDAAALAGKPQFGSVYPAFQAFIGKRVIIGHNIGFDLAVLERECALVGASPFTNRVLDTRLLGELCFPRLGGFTLDKLASHLGLEAHDRHDALADAELTANVFLALIPSLKEHGIRSLAEAETACRRLTAVLDDYNRAGWSEPVRPKAVPDAVLGRIDAFPFRHRVKDVASMPPIYVGPGMPLGETITMMAQKGISSVFVSAAAHDLVEPVGIITERDVIKLVGEQGAAALSLPVGTLSSRPLMTVPAEAFVYRAIGRMEKNHIRHLGVVDETGKMIGALSARDLLRLRSSDALALGDAIDNSNNIGQLASAWARMPQVARRLLDEGITSREVAAVISREIGALTRRAAIEAEKRMLSEGYGPAPAAYSTLILGSGGRGESLLIPDQDNATIYDSLDNHDAWFLRHGGYLADFLDQVGIPLCKGKVMASNPVWNGSWEAWQKRIEGWANSTTPSDLLSVDIFYDFRHVHGDAALAKRLRDEALLQAHSALPMVKLLADQLKQWSAPVGLFGRLQLTDGRIDLKKGGLFPIVSAARCLALSHGIAARATSERIAALRAEQIGADSDLEALDNAHIFLSALILRQQLTDIAEARPPSTLVDPALLSRSELAQLKETFSNLGDVSTMVHDLLFHAARRH